MSLTKKQIEKLKTMPGRYFDRDGLYLQIPKFGAMNPRHSRASWLLRYVLDGRERWLGLGPLSVVPLETEIGSGDLHDRKILGARDKARLAKQLILDGIDPIEQKRADRAARLLATQKRLTFEEAAAQYFDQHSPKWKNKKHTAQFLSTMKGYVYPKFGKISVAAIDTGLVLKAIEPIWHTKTETASRVRNRIEAVLDWAGARGYRTGDNPARWKGHLAEVLPARSLIAKAEHHAALPFAELPNFWTTLNVRDGVAARALNFLILTAARSGEVLGATWDEIDFDKKTWTVPAARMKADKAHRVPLSEPALEILSALPRLAGNPFVFVGQRDCLGKNEMAKVLKRLGRDNVTVHGFRSAFRDWAAERTAYPNHIVEQALAHAIGNAVERAYLRSDLFDKRRKLMADWAKFFTTVKATANVVPIRKAV
jgi:integrase